MLEPYAQFENIVRRASQFTEARSLPSGGLHPFEERNIHPKLPGKARELFDDGHYAQATFEAYKFIDKEVQRHSGWTDSGFKLMMKVFDKDTPLIKLTSVSSMSEKDEQEGFRFLFAGSILAIRNPRGHEHSIVDSPDKCLDHLSLASLLIRRIEDAGFK